MVNERAVIYIEKIHYLIIIALDIANGWSACENLNVKKKLIILKRNLEKLQFVCKSNVAQTHTEKIPMSVF